MHEDAFAEDTEEGKSVVYLDNATIINACSVLADPARFDAYKLLDLESFCEAFLLFDCVRTLVGSSFACGFSSGYQFPNKDSWTKPIDFAKAVWTYPKTRLQNQSISHGHGSSTFEIYEDLIDRGLLRPVILGAGSVHYGIENIDVLDALATTIDIKQTIGVIKDVFGNDIPWDYKVRNDRDLNHRHAWSNLIIGEETWTSDSYPVYYFPKPKSEQKERGKDDIDFGWELNNNREIGRFDTFVSQTFFYVVEASLHKRPYLCSSVRVPIVRDMVSQLNKQFISTVHGSLNLVSHSTREKVEAALRFLGAGAVDFLYLPALFAVFREAKHRTEVVSTLLEMRQRPHICKYRQWCATVDRAWRDQDLNGVFASITELKELTLNLASSLTGQPIRGTLNHLADVQMLIRNDTSRIAERELVRSCFNPSLSFAKDIGSYLQMITDNRNLLEGVLNHKLTDGDVNTLQQLQARRSKLYSPGEIEIPRSSVTVESMEITMGDTFRDIRNSIIATRGSIAEGVISLREKGDQRLAEAVATLDRLIHEASNDLLNSEKKLESADLLRGMLEEANKPKPNKNILKSLGESLISALSVVKPLAEAGKDAFEVVKTLWS